MRFARGTVKKLITCEGSCGVAAPDMYRSKSSARILKDSAFKFSMNATAQHCNGAQKMSQVFTEFSQTYYRYYFTMRFNTDGWTKGKASELAKILQHQFPEVSFLLSPSWSNIPNKYERYCGPRRECVQQL